MPGVLFYLLTNLPLKKINLPQSAIPSTPNKNFIFFDKTSMIEKFSPVTK